MEEENTRGARDLATTPVGDVDVLDSGVDTADEACETEAVPSSHASTVDPRTLYPKAVVDVTKHAIYQARRRWPGRFSAMNDEAVAMRLLEVYYGATTVERRNDGKWRYGSNNFYGFTPLWVVATVGYDHQTVVLVTCYPARQRVLPATRTGGEAVSQRTQPLCANMSWTGPLVQFGSMIRTSHRRCWRRQIGMPRSTLRRMRSSVGVRRSPGDPAPR